MPAREQFDALARAWLAAGRPAQRLLDGYDLIALRCWSWSRGAKAEGVGAEIEAFRRACEAAQPDNWLDAYLSERETCAGCGESWRFENVGLCTHCHRRWCYRCGANHPAAANGNPGCSCGQGEVVG